MGETQMASKIIQSPVLLASLAAGAVLTLVGCSTLMSANRSPAPQTAAEAEGRQIFRYDTFGDEQLWTDKLRMAEIVDRKVTPLQALGLGLKVDMDKLNFGSFILHNPLGASGTRELLREDAVVGLKATFDNEGRVQRIGVTCALCHSTVDDAMLPGIGHRLDGWPNHTLNVGAVIALSPVLTPQQRAVYNSWGKGRYDPRYNFDGKNTPLEIPPAYGLADVKNETYTAEGPISYWNAYVAVTQMGGHGDFSDPRLGIDIHQTPDLVTAKLAPLRAYQHGIPAPVAGRASASAAAAHGQAVFATDCQSCHVGGNGTDNNAGILHQPSETGMDGAYAARTAVKAYRTTPLRGLRFHAPYFHDGSAATLSNVVDHYDRVRHLQLSARDKHDLVEYLKTL